MVTTHVICILYVVMTNQVVFATEVTTAPCPANFQELDNFCYLEIKNTTFPYNCPLKTTGNYEQSRSLIYNGWMNVQRDSTYGVFRSPKLSLSYGDIIWSPVLIANDFEDCIIGPIRWTANCNDKHTGFCVYYKNDRQYCDAYNKICNTNLNCHCQAKNVLYLCQAMCEPSHVHKEECSICDQKFARYPEPKIQISFNGIDRIRVNVIGPLKLIILQPNNLPVHCFTDVHHPQTTVIQYRYRSILTEMESMTRSTYSFKIKADAIGRYWCEGFTLETHTKVVSNTIIAGLRGDHGLTLVFNFTVAVLRLTPYRLHIDPPRSIPIMSGSLSAAFRSFRVPMIPPLHNNRSMANISVHVTTRLNLTNAEHFHKEISQVLRSSCQYRNCLAFYTDICLPELTSVGPSLIVSWPQTLLGQQAVSKKIILENGVPITRQCIGSFMTGAYWSNVMGQVSNRRGSSVTDVLYELLRSNKTAEELNGALFATISHAENIIPLDVYFVAEITKIISQSEEEFNIEMFVENLNIVMDFDLDVLQLAQNELNATDTILYSFDVALGRFAGNITTTINSKYIMAQITPLEKSGGIRGIALYHRKWEEMQFKNLTNITNLYNSTDFNGLKVAVLIPPRIIEEIFVQSETPSLVTSIFLNDALFRSVKNDGVSPANLITGVFVTNFVGVHLPEPLPIIFEPGYTSMAGTKVSCGFWKFGIKDVVVAIHGRWQKEQFPKSLRQFKTCAFTHMTHFALLANAPRNHVLDLISLIGCVMSVLGVLGIVITALVFKAWRNSTSTKILLNLSLTILIQMTLLFLSHLRTPSWWCTILALSLHYIILSQFFWMFIIGYLQYRKFVQVLVEKPAHLLLYSSLFAWLIPTFPVVIIFFLDKSSYTNPAPFCFLSGSSLHFGLFLPLGCIIVSNLTIFTLIFVNLSCTKIRAFGAKQSTFLLRLKLSLLLFFLMGFSWIFGLLAYFFKSIVLSHMFCITSTVQGFVFYVYFIMCNKRTRMFWAENVLCCLKNEQKSLNSDSPLTTKSK